MSTVDERGESPPATRFRGWSEYGVAAILAVLGVVVLYEAGRVSTALARDGAIGPRTVPYAVGALLLLTAALLAVDIARGGRGAEEEGEDIDLSHGTEWVTLLALVALFAATGQLIPIIGFPASGVVLFFGVSRILGGRRLWRDLLVSIAVPVLAFLLFTQALGVYLPAGPTTG